MERWTVVLMETDFLSGGGKIRTIGDYPSEVDAERARRRIHFTAASEVAVWQRFPERQPRTYVTKIEQEQR